MFFGGEPNDFIRGGSEDLMRASPGEAGRVLFKNVGRQKRDEVSISVHLPSQHQDTLESILNRHRI